MFLSEKNIIIPETVFRKKSKISAVYTIICDTFSLDGASKQRPAFFESPAFFIFMIVPQKGTSEYRQSRHQCPKIRHNYSFVFLRDQTAYWKLSPANLLYIKQKSSEIFRFQNSFGTP